ncbi:MAG: OmpA family protein [Rubritepida sp.]|nr:OmpA family protein [Rubritepida sp.]
MAAAGLAMPGLAQAQFFAPVTQPITGLYIGAGAGVNFADIGTLRATEGLAPAFRSRGIGTTGRALFEPGFAGVFAVGYGLGNGIRLEVEGNYRQNDVRKIRGFSGAGLGTRADGEQRTYGVMGNAYYDFNIPYFPWFTPYVGAGVGYAWREWQDVRTSALNGAAALRPSGTEANFAYQGMLGGAFNITSVPGLAVTAEYRYFRVLGGTYQTRLTSGLAPTGVTLAGGNLRAENAGNHSAMLGLRYAFNQPAPFVPVVAAPAAPVQQVARTYLVFFDWNRADLTDRARQIIADAAAARTSARATRIEVAGHADRSGTDRYNQALSLRRAEAVASELTRRGVSRSDIGIQGFGESRPLVSTADGVREPQNRRVEIVLR